jgi:hypothetical protein
MMQQNYDFVGTYQREGAKLISGTITLLISERKQITPTKPKFFIVDKSTPKGCYISSLFPIRASNTTGEVLYHFDYKSIKYKLILNEATAQIII